jgi:hypothetical protein
MVIKTISSLQIFAHIPILNIVLPANVISMFQILIPVVTFDILEPLGIFKSIYPNSEDDAERFMEDLS